MKRIFSRTHMLLGDEAMQKLENAKVAVFGIGGVGGYAAEALVRSGIGEIHVIDNDAVSPSNINRQLYALHSTVGQDKVDVAKKRMLDINPDVKVEAFKTFYNEETASQFDFKNYDYIVDAVDTVSAKILLVMKAKEAGTPIISSMGTGNKLCPQNFEVADIYKTSMCPLAKVMRYELKRRGVKKLKVVYSKEQPVMPIGFENMSNDKRRTPASTPFVPPVAGFIIAAEVVKDIIKK